LRQNVFDAAIFICFHESPLIMPPRYKVLISIFFLLIGSGALWFLPKRNSLSPDELARRNASSERAFTESYLNPGNGIYSTNRRACLSCHANQKELNLQHWNFLTNRFALERQKWADEAELQARCGSCHLVPDPATLASDAWTEVFARMAQIADIKTVPKLNEDERRDLLHYYFTFSPEQLPLLAEDPDPAESPLKFERSVFGNALPEGSREHPVLGHVQIVDLDQDGQLDVLVCDTDKSMLNWIHRTNGAWVEETLGRVPCPAHTEIITNSNNNLDIIVACQKVMAPTDDPVGSVVLLKNNGRTQFSPVTLIDELPRVSDVQPGDLDGDGDLDFVVAAYGYLKEGEIGWLENKDGAYRYHSIMKRPGAIHVPVIDLNGDGKLDFVALFAQEYERISAFLSDGKGTFAEKILFEADTPAFGSSGIQLVDLDRDGDIDILYTNGDNMDLPSVVPRPYHGVQWLENKGDLNFEWHNIRRFYGAYCAVACDLNGDGHLDIVVTSMFNDWSNPKRASLIWLENDGAQKFRPHSIARAPTSLISAAVADLDGNGALDIVASGMHAFPPYDRMGRVTLWKNVPRTRD
jgi:hypothetical protein